MELIPKLTSGKILDIGSGKGGFLIDAAKAGLDAYGIEVCKEYIDISNKKAEEQHVTLNIVKGVGESLPFEDEVFDLINLSEVIEHVESPDMLLSEISRVLKIGGYVYISVPSRFSWYDTHYHLLFLNWMPRSWSHKLIGLLGKHKEYSKDNGKQRIDEMFYSTFNSFRKKVLVHGMKAADIRVIKINKKCTNPVVRFLAITLYKILRPFYFKTFHFLLTK
jgi:ubiquinone/menaquinone biosynthesis C-methylase UbiE